MPLAGYRRMDGVYDECVGEEGVLRAHYAKFAASLEQVGAAELKRRWESCARLVHEQGITYNVHGEPRGLERPWKLDPAPLLIAADDWRALEQGLVQRAKLINRVLADCYGRQELVRSGWLPPALVFGQCDFLRPCHGLQPAGGTFLNFYAADLARSPDGRWWVVSDRTQIPTGAGYALANRLVTSRLLPEAYRESQVHRLAGFFRETQKTLARLAPSGVEDPRIVLLTPGPYNESYFEQSYLARYLGYPLVEGQDLTVRDERVFLKTLAGLEPVHVILRRVDDEFCDPLELRNNSMLGVPGFIEAARAGNAAMANPPGSSLLQSPSFMAFLPGLCRQVLGEELKLPSVATWWCGQKAAEEYVLEHLDELFVRPAFRVPGRGWEADNQLTKQEREALMRRIQFQPRQFVAQERMRPSTAPSLMEGRLAARPVMLRVYLVATEDGYAVMPGGLARVSPPGDCQFVSMQHGVASKDTWVLSEDRVEEISLLAPQSRSIELRRVGNNLSSRLADNFFWLGRYAERADAASRLLRAAMRQFSPETGGGDLPHLAPLLETLDRLGQLANDKTKRTSRPGPDEIEADLFAAIFDAQREGSLRQLTSRLQRLAMSVRDLTSTDLWRAANHLGDLLSEAPGAKTTLAADALDVLNQILLGLASIHGLARENMTRAQGWRFIDMGLRVERALSICTFLDRALRSPEADNPSLLEAVLEVADSTLTYRSRYNVVPHIAAVYDLVLLDDTNPRSLFFQLHQLTQHFERLPRECQGDTPQNKILRHCKQRLTALDPRELASLPENPAESQIGRVLVEMLGELPRFSDAITASYFAHSEISRTGGNGQR